MLIIFYEVFSTFQNAGAYDSGLVGPRLHDVANGGELGILLFCSPGFWDVGVFLRALSSPGG